MSKSLRRGDLVDAYASKAAAWEDQRDGSAMTDAPTREGSETMPDKPNCYRCIYRGEVPGSAHSSCHHPDVGAQGPMAEAMAILAGVGRAAPVIGQGSDKLKIKANAHGIRRGWFNWPFNFDPTWLENCEGFTPEREDAKALRAEEAGG